MPVKPICFYLPQFHRIPENDRWWGEGFTEWNMVRAAQPQFGGHYQPVVPHPDLGYYNLLDAAVRRKQAEIARAYGVYGFCYYHYWFAGKLLLEQPLERMLIDGQPDLPYCLSWANENWTRRWDGKEDEVIMAQQYGDKADWAAHFDYLLRFFRHPRYIRVQGRPLFLVYRVTHSPLIRDMLEDWRKRAHAAGLPGLYVLSTLNGWTENRAIREQIDGGCEFYPSYLWRRPTASRMANQTRIFQFDEGWDRIYEVPRQYAVQFRGSFHAWDNTPRRSRGGGIAFEGGSPAKYRSYLQEQFRRTLADTTLPEPFVFLNSWNEWGEGAHLEPDQRFGYAYLESVRDAMTAAANPHRKHTRNPLCLPKHPEYSVKPRTEVIEFLSRHRPPFSSVLELGCGAGVAAKQIRERFKPRRYVGVDCDAESAECARLVLDEVFVTDLDKNKLSSLGLGSQRFDLLVALDVLEHLYDPWEVLTEAVTFLQPGGHLLLSLPNIQNINVLLDLVAGEWPYRSWGLLDVTHLRFFTYLGLCDLVAGAGLQILHKQVVTNAPLDVAELKDQQNEIQKGPVTLTGLTREEVIQLHTMQYLVIARRRPAGNNVEPATLTRSSRHPADADKS